MFCRIVELDGLSRAASSALPTLAAAAPQFAARYPDLTLKLSVSDRIVGSVEEGVDVLIRIGELKDSNMVAHRAANLVPLRRLAGVPEAIRRTGDAGGGGTIQLLSLTMNPAFAAGTLQPILADRVAPGPPVSVIYPQQRQAPAKVRAFVEFVAALFRLDGTAGKALPALRSRSTVRDRQTGSHR